MLPLVSVAFHTTRVMPKGKMMGALFTTLWTPQLSVTPGVPRLTLVAVHVPKSAATLTAAGQLITGGVTSTTDRTALLLTRSVSPMQLLTVTLKTAPLSTHCAVKL